MVCDDAAVKMINNNGDVVLEKISFCVVNLIAEIIANCTDYLSVRGKSEKYLTAAYLLQPSHLNRF